MTSAKPTRSTTPLVHADRCGQMDMVRLLLKKGAKLDVEMGPDSINLSQFIYSHAVSRGQTSIVRLLIEYGVQPEKDPGGR